MSSEIHRSEDLEGNGFDFQVTNRESIFFFSFKLKLPLWKTLKAHIDLLPSTRSNLCRGTQASPHPSQASCTCSLAGASLYPSTTSILRAGRQRWVCCSSCWLNLQTSSQGGCYSGNRLWDWFIYLSQVTKFHLWEKKSCSITSRPCPVSRGLV